MVKFYFEENDEEGLTSVSMQRGFVGSTHFDSYTEFFFDFMKAVGYTSGEDCEVFKVKDVEELYENIDDKQLTINKLQKELNQLKKEKQICLEEHNDYDELDEDSDELLETAVSLIIEDEYSYMEDDDNDEDTDEFIISDSINTSLTMNSEDIEEHNDYDNLEDDMIVN